MKTPDPKEPIGHWIIPGDWVIREAPDAIANDDYEEFRNPTGYALADRAVHVLDVTKSHITIFDPIVGRKEILQLSAFPGTWRRATRAQIDATWEMAYIRRPKESLGSLDIEKKTYGPK